MSMTLSKVSHAPSSPKAHARLPAAPAELRGALDDQMTIYDDKVAALLKNVRPTVTEKGNTDRGLLKLDYKLKSRADAKYVSKSLNDAFNAIDENTGESLNISDFSNLSFKASSNHLLVAVQWTRVSDESTPPKAKSVVAALQSGVGKLPVSDATKRVLAQKPTVSSLSHASDGTVDAMYSAANPAEALAIKADLTAHRSDLGKLFTSLHGLAVSKIAAQADSGLVTVHLEWKAR